ncbi:MAG: hypothetical protein ACK47B_10725 [Armatimonadota bacterium]
MPVELTPEEMAFADRVDRYCRERRTQPEMAALERLSLGGFRARLQRCGLEVVSTTERRLVRLRSGEPFMEARERGEFVTAPAEPAEVA